MRGFLVILAVVVCWTALGWAQESLPLLRVDVVGNDRISQREIIAATGLTEGDPVDASRLRRAAQSVEQMGYFARVVPDMSVQDNHIVARITVVEYPVIERITLVGVPEVATGTLWAVLRSWLTEPPRVPESRIRSILRDHDIRPGNVLNAVQLRKALEKILETYQERDVVTVQIGQVIPGEELIIEIQELPVLGNRVSGLVTVPEEEALRHIEVPVGEVGRRSQIQASLVALMRLGYFDKVDVLPEQGDAGVWLHWKLEERSILGEPTVLAGIELLGVEALPHERVTGRLGDLPDGQVGNFEVLQALAPVYEYYRREGYFMVTMVGEVVGDLLQVQVHEGRLGDTSVEGNTRTADQVVLRVLGLQEGEFLTEARLAQAQQGLMALGYFSDVQLEPKWDDEDNLVNLKVRVKELDRLGHIRGAMSYSPQEKGIVGNVEYAQKNILGTAQDVSLSLARGLSETGSTTWSLGYTGYAFPVFNMVKGDLYRRESAGRLTFGGEGTLSYPLAPYWSLRTTVLTERSWTVQDMDSLQPRTAIRVGVTYSDRDSPMFPRRGHHMTLSVEKAGTFAPGAEYLSMRADLARYWPVDVDTWVWEGRAALAQRVLVRGGWDLPSGFQFALGGVDSVRGAQGTTVSGMALVNTELRFELAQGFAVAAFWDVGTALTKPMAVSSMGAELSAHIAGMFVRLIMAWPDDRDPSWVPVFEFAMSPMF